MPTETEIEQGNAERCRRISNRTFPVIKDLKTLELGPQDGSHFTQHLIKYTDDVTVIELDELAANKLKLNYPIVNVIKDDFNECLRSVGRFDAVILYGVLYHSHVTLKILEDIANFINPTYVLLENIGGSASYYASNNVAVTPEESNLLGMRSTKIKSCNLVLCFGQEVFDTAMTNLGYVQVDGFDIAYRQDLMNSPGELKKMAYYTTWKLK
jgi:hypothetical protein